MSSAHTIDLFSFPLMPLQGILRSFDLSSLFILSLCSKKAHDMLKFVRHHSKANNACVKIKAESFKIEVEFKTNRNIVIESKDGSVVLESNFCENGFFHREGKIEMSISDFQNIWKTTGRRLDVCELMKYNCDLFDTDLCWFWLIEDETDSKMNIKEIVSNAPPTVNFFCDLYNMPNEDYYYVLKNVRATRLEIYQTDHGCDELNLDMSTSNIQYFRSNRAGWITLRHLMDWDFIEVVLEGVSLKSMELNSILMSWKRGQKTNMRYLNIRISLDCLLDEDVVLSGLTAEIMDEEEDEKLFHRNDKFHEQMVKPIKGGYEILANDGGVCRVFINRWEIKCYFWSSS